MAIDLRQAVLRKRVSMLVIEYGWQAVQSEVSYHQPASYAASAPARLTDPETSHLAAKEEQDVGRFSERSRKGRLLELFATGDYTDQEAALHVLSENAGISQIEGTRRRVSELREVGYLREVGRRCNPGSDDESIVSGLTRAGRQTLVRLRRTGWSRAKRRSSVAA